jgi:hypothetical protein
MCDERNVILDEGRESSGPRFGGEISYEILRCSSTTESSTFFSAEGKKPLRLPGVAYVPSTQHASITNIRQLSSQCKCFTTCKCADKAVGSVANWVEPDHGSKPWRTPPKAPDRRRREASKKGRLPHALRGTPFRQRRRTLCAEEDRHIRKNAG